MLDAIEADAKLMDMDEDEYASFVSSGYKKCPMFKLDDEYGIVRKQN